MKLRDFLNWILNHFPARPSDEELITFGRLEEREAQRKQAETPAQIPTIRLPNGATVIIDPTVRARGYLESAWNSEPDKQTDPYAAIHQQLQQRRMLARHNTTTLARKVHLIADDPDVTQYNIPAWIKDQATKP